MRVLLALLLVLLLSGATCQRRPDLPIPANCNAMCFVECKSQAKWEGDPESAEAWDSLAGDTLPASRDETRTCEVRRNACEQCFKRLEDAGVLTL